MVLRTTLNLRSLLRVFSFLFSSTRRYTIFILVTGFQMCFFFFSSRRRHTRFDCDWSSDVCSSDLFCLPSSVPVAIVLDIKLPVMDGWTVLDHLKHHSDTRHIPVHIVTGTDDGRQNALRAGAVAFLEKDRKSVV